MALVYSTRFLTAGFGGTATYTVPAGNRAVIRSITAYNDAASANSWWVAYSPGTIYIAGDVLAANSQTAIQNFFQSYDLRVVVNAGESIEAFAGDGAFVTVSGYLFAG